MRLPSALIFLGILAPIGGVPADTADYWRCVDGEWIAQGRPGHPRPNKSCGWHPRIPQRMEECVQQGGAWGPVGIFPMPVCRLQTNDAGNPCADGDECESACIAELDQTELTILKGGKLLRKLGRCAPTSMVVGCHAFVVAGEITGITCLD